MKKFFKLMSIALLSCSLLTVVSCKDDPEENTDPNNNNNSETPDNPEPQPDPALTIKWGGSPATIGFSEAYQFANGSTVFVVYASKDFVNEQYGKPLFRLGLDLDTDPTYGCALTAQYSYGSNGIAGNSAWPTDVVEEGFYDSQIDQVMGFTGDWWLDQYTGANEDFKLNNAQYDANALTLSTSFAVQMFSYTDVQESITSSSTNEEVLAAINAARKKNLEVTINNLSFDAAKRVSDLTKVK